MTDFEISGKAYSSRMISDLEIIFDFLGAPFRWHQECRVHDYQH
jgi:hypothetical protein